MNVIKATSENLPEAARLFDLYRQFYACKPDLKLASEFLADRLSNNESDVFLAVQGDHTCGFVQLYRSFCSVDAIKIVIVHDLFVESTVRKSGVGEALMNRVTQWAKESGAGRLDLLTDKTNIAGQTLYEKLGYKKVLEEFYAYSLNI